MVYHGIERVEIAIRAAICNTLGARGSLSYKLSTNFRPNFGHKEWLDTSLIRTARARRNSEMVRHHQAEYRGELPIWALVEVLDFADVSKLYSGLLAHDQREIAENLGITIDDSELNHNQRTKARKHHPLVSWMEQLTVVRNTAAHHSRLWNRTFIPVPTAAMRTVLGLENLPEQQSERLYGALLVMAKIIHNAYPGYDWPVKIAALINNQFTEISHRSIAEMGFPNNWEQLSPWK